MYHQENFHAICFKKKKNCWPFCGINIRTIFPDLINQKLCFTGCLINKWTTGGKILFMSLLIDPSLPVTISTEVHPTPAIVCQICFTVRSTAREMSDAQKACYYWISAVCATTLYRISSYLRSFLSLSSAFAAKSFGSRWLLTAASRPDIACIWHLAFKTV